LWPAARREKIQAREAGASEIARIHLTLDLS
jgi:hypothetical protein